MRRRAFTLVELLVVIGIIAVLIGMLLPALGNARQHAISVQCLANLRSCGQAFYTYANQNRGYFPMMFLSEPQRLPNGEAIGTANGGTEQGISGLYFTNTKEAMARIINPKSDPTATPFSAGNIKIMYCPANFFWDADTPGTTGSGLSHYPDDFMATRGRINYWYFGNPNPYAPQNHYRGPFSSIGQPPESQGGATVGTLDWRFWDTNHSGDNRDEYIVKLGDKNMAKNVLMTDHSRQSKQGATTVGFQFVHGRSRNFLYGWKNNLYGDGHAESRKARSSSFSPDGTAFINTNPSPEEIQPRWGNASGYQMW